MDDWQAKTAFWTIALVVIVEQQQTVTQIIDEFLKTENIAVEGGQHESRKNSSPIAGAWRSNRDYPGFLRNEWTHAFKLLKKG